MKVVLLPTSFEPILLNSVTKLMCSCSKEQTLLFPFLRKWRVIHYTIVVIKTITIGAISATRVDIGYAVVAISNAITNESVTINGGSC